MCINVYLKGRRHALSFGEARRLEWVSRPVEILRYGKPQTDNEAWCVLYDALKGGREVAHFKGTEVMGYVVREITF